MIEATVMGIFGGLISGLIPAAGVLTTLVMMLPLLTYLSASELLLFYMVMATVTQYITAIPSILISVPGHPSSMYTVIESNKISPGQKKQVLGTASLHSFFAVMGTILILVLASSLIDQHISTLFRSEIIFLLLLLTLSLTTGFSKNNMIVSIVLLGVGIALSFVGYNFFFDTDFTFGLTFIAAGLDPVIVVLLFLSFPELVRKFHQPSLSPPQNMPARSESNNLANSSTAASVGFLGGLVPGLTTIASSSFYYYLGRLFKLRPQQLVVGTETANAVGSISQVLPVLYFGIPILASEALLLALMQSQGFSISLFDLSAFFSSSFGYFILANLVALAVCLFAANTKFVMNLALLNKIAVILLIVSLVFYVLFNGNTDIKLMQLLMLLPFALLFGRLDTTPVVVGFLISPMFFESASRIF
jgi:putative tricarboxylic transport membrane protein